jgi:inhibitor of cysteine peptidase
MITTNRNLPQSGAIDMTHMPKLLFIVGIVAAAVLVAGCTSGGNQPPSTNVTAAMPLLLNESMNGSTIAVPLNTTLTLELKENPTTGYAWNLSTTEGLRVASSDYIPDDPKGTLVGAGGVHRWKIEAVATGLQDITGIYARPWENSTADATTYSAEISVTP